MGELWRSKEMSLLQLVLQEDVAHDTIEAVGQLRLLQFVDVNTEVPLHSRTFVPEIKRLGSLKLKVRDIANDITETNRIIKKLRKEKIDEGEAIIKPTPLEKIVQDKPLSTDSLEERVDEVSAQLREFIDRQMKLDQTKLQLEEISGILGEDENFFSDINTDEDDNGVEMTTEESEVNIKLETLVPAHSPQKKRESTSINLEDEEDENTKLRFISGTVLEEKFHSFEVTLYRMSKGNAFIKPRFEPLEIKEPGVSQPVSKLAFIIFYRGKYLGNKIVSLCQAYNAHVYQIPEIASGRRVLRKQIQIRKVEIDDVIKRGIETKGEMLAQVAAVVELWHHFVVKEIAIYDSMNLFSYDQGKHMLIGEGWCPKDCIETVKDRMREATRRIGGLDPIINEIHNKNRTPPTYFPTNKFTKVFQKIVDAYGIARYREVNPAVFTVITFPWQFGIMFGDFGHGLMLTTFSVILILLERKLERKNLNEILQWPYNGRYLLLLMGLFSMFMGALYNECFALTMDFGSNWVYNNKTGSFDILRYGPSGTYAFGVDPVWKGSTNELLYYNSVKMKMSIIVGVIQMTLGIFLHLFNAWEFHELFLDGVFEFLPRLLFLESIFGYLCFMIFYKWSRNWMGQDKLNAMYNVTNPTGMATGTSGAPVILNELIFMFLPSGSGGDALYPGQTQVQTALVAIAGITIPIMLFPKPCILRHEHNRHKKKMETLSVGTVVPVDDDKLSSEESLEESKGKAHEKEIPKPIPSSPRSPRGGGGGAGSGGHVQGEAGKKPGPGDDEFNFGELMIAQLLETIEFVLGSVSHTASYLRLWALSLAHSELATVFYFKIMFEVIDITKDLNLVVVGLITFCGFSVWFAVTILVMLFMELLSALLHALRLHWVEFQSKFYKGDGILFKPFSLRSIQKKNKLFV